MKFDLYMHDGVLFVAGYSLDGDLYELPYSELISFLRGRSDAPEVENTEKE